MTSSWVSQAGRIDCSWSDMRRQARPDWLESESATDYGAYLSPPIDFASHSPFGGPTWFDRWHYRERESQ